MSSGGADGAAGIPAREGDVAPSAGSEARLRHEREHARTLLDRGPRYVWGWGSPAGRLRAERRLRFFIERGGLTPESRVLELGCGTGTFTRGLAATGARITAIDISPELLEQARAEGTFPNVTYEVHDAMKTRLADAAFDAVIGCSVLHHLDPVSALAEAWRVLRPGGRLVLSEPNMMNPQVALQKNVAVLKRWMGDSPDETAFFTWELRSLLERQGFVGIEIAPFDFLHPSTPVALIGLVDALGRVLERLPLIREIAGSIRVAARKPESAGAG